MTKALALAVALLAVLAVGWVAGELHYRNCVEAATVATPDAGREKPPASRFQWGPGDEAIVAAREERQRRLAACSRIPV